MSDPIRYPERFKQDMDRVFLAQLSRYCTYEGHAPDLQHLKGLLIETARVEDVVYVGERDNIACRKPDGTPFYPWRSIEISEYDEFGKIVHRGNYNEPIVYAGKGAMDRADLGALGFTDQWLSDQAKELLGETYEPQASGPSQLRRAVFNRVMKKAYGQ